MSRFAAFCLFVIVCIVESAAFTVRVPVRDDIRHLPVSANGYIYNDSMKIVAKSMLAEKDGTLVFMFPKRPTGYQMMIMAKPTDGNGMKQAEYEDKWVNFDVPADAADPYEFPVVYLERYREKELEEVTVTPTVVKFYHKGDTLVFNANAFVLSEGSMLDALIKQLPGVTLNSSGEIYCNNRKIDNLLLNGRDIFNGNKHIMLENLAAYTVRDIAVYDKRGRAGELMGRNVGDNLHVMDVRLKKQYSNGWIINAEAGYGTKDRYLGRLFASWFSDYVSVTAIGNVNNLSDFNAPKREDGPWSTRLSEGVGTNRHGGVMYSAQGRDSGWELKGDVFVENREKDVFDNVNTESSGDSNDIYGYQWTDTTSRVLKVRTRHEFFTRFGNRANLTATPDFSYSITDMEGDVVSASFLTKMASLSRRRLLDIYSLPNSVPMTDSMINRTVNELASHGRGLSAKLALKSDIKLKSSGQSNMLTLNAESAFDTGDEERFDRYRINYGKNPDPEISRHRYFHYSPNYERYLKASATFIQFLDYHMIKLPLKYEFQYRHKRLASNVYLLPPLGLGVDVLPPPEDYIKSVDFDMTFSQCESERRHTIGFVPNHAIGFKLGGPLSYSLTVMPAIYVSFVERRYDFTKYDIPTEIRRTDVLTEGYLSFHFYKARQGAWIYDLSFNMDTSPVNMSWLVDYPSDNPMIVFKGNPDLKNQSKYSGLFRATYETTGNLKHVIRLDASAYRNGQHTEMKWDETTGIQTFTTENTKGNWNADAGYSIYVPFGPQRMFTLESSTLLNYSKNTLMSLWVKQGRVGEKIRLNWQPGRHRFDLFANANYAGYSFSESQASPKNFTAWTCRYGAEAVLNLPHNWGISTDLTLYTRRGFSDSRLNTTDLVWNARVSKSILKGQLVFVADAYDLLRQLSNVNYLVDAQTRTEVVSNVIPSYVLFHVQWRFNKQPKR